MSTLHCLCFLDFTYPEANKESTRKVTENDENVKTADGEANKEFTRKVAEDVEKMMTAVSEVLNATDSAFLKVPAEARGHLPALNWVKK